MGASPHREKIIEFYAGFLREHGKPPVSVFQFTKDLGLSEQEFFSTFPTLECVESEFWADQLKHVVIAVESGEEWTGFSARDRLLTFYYAWFEHAMNIRSLMLLRFAPLGPLKNAPYLKGFNRGFREFAKKIIAHGIASGEVASRGKLSDIYPDAMLTSFRSMIDFNLKDESPGYERTDAFVEKSVKLGFEMIRTQALDSALDLARFLIPEMRR